MSTVLGKSKIRHLDFETLVLINKNVVSLTGEKHEYTEEDEKRIKLFLKEIEGLAADDPQDDILKKASLLIFKVASGQYFHEGNKRTALVAGLAFLQVNGYTLDIKDSGLVSVVDKAGVSTANLNHVEAVLRKQIRIV